MSDSNNVIINEPLKVYTNGGRKQVEKFSDINEHHSGRAYQRKLIDGKWERVRSDGGVERVSKDLVLKNQNGSTRVDIPAGVSGYLQLIPSSRSGGYGNMAQITDSEGKVIARFAHLEKFNPELKSGQFINRGTSLGIQGTTGRSTGIHLHAEMPASEWPRYIEDTIKGRFQQAQNSNESMPEIKPSEIFDSYPSQLIASALSSQTKSIQKESSDINNVVMNAGQVENLDQADNGQKTAFLPLTIPAIPPLLQAFITFATGILAGLTVSAITESTKSALGSGELTNAMSPESKQKLINTSEIMNKLVDAVKSAEANAINNPSQKSDYLQLATINRQQISKVYTEMASIMSEDLRNIRQNSPKMVPHAQEVIRGLQESAIKVLEIGSDLSEFRPQNIRSEGESTSQRVAAVSPVESQPVAGAKSGDREINVTSNSLNYPMIALLINARSNDMKNLGLDVQNSSIDLDAAIVCYAQSNGLNPDSLMKQSPAYQALSGAAADSYQNDVIGKAQVAMTINAESRSPVRATESQR